MQATRTPNLAPYILVRNANGFVKFVENALGGTLTFEARGEDGTIHHAEVRIGDSLLMLAETPPGRQPFPAMLHLYVEDVDDAYSRLLKGGATAIRAPRDERDGDRRGAAKDAWGNEWWVARPPAE